MKEIVRVACTNNFNCTPAEWGQLHEFSQKYPDRYFFVNSNINTPALFSINKHDFKAVITVNPNLAPDPKSLNRLLRLDQTKIAFVRVKWLPENLQIRRLFTSLLMLGYTVVLTLQRFNGKASLARYTNVEHYKFDCSRYRLHGDPLTEVLGLVDSYKAAGLPAYVCDRSGKGCLGCGQCATLTTGSLAPVTSLNLSTSGICKFNCPDCYAKTMQHFLRRMRQPLIHYDQIFKNRKQAGRTKHIKDAVKKAA